MNIKERFTFREKGEEVSNLEISIRISSVCLDACLDIQSTQVSLEHNQRYARLIEKITALDRELIQTGGTLEEVYSKLDLSSLQDPVEFSEEQVGALKTVFDSKNIRVAKYEIELVVNNEIALSNLEKIYSGLMNLYIGKE